MLRVMRPRGADLSAIWRDDVALLGVARHSWEMDPGFSGPLLAAEEGGIAVVADASIFYRRELRNALERAGVAPASDAPSHLILAAYRAWGPACTERLEGDWAFILWDHGARRGQRDQAPAPACGARIASGPRPCTSAGADRHDWCVSHPIAARGACAGDRGNVRCPSGPGRAGHRGRRGATAALERIRAVRRRKLGLHLFFTFQTDSGFAPALPGSSVPTLRCVSAGEPRCCWRSER